MQVINALPGNKTPGPDGFTSEFYKSFKLIIVADLQQVYNHVINSDRLTPHPLNDSYMVLIPKKEGVVQPTDFKPISLINSVQIFFSKIMANRMRLVISEFVMESQIGFVKGRHINEGFLYAQEVVTMAQKQRQQIGLFKADVFKAFDTLSWGFLQEVLTAKGFSQNWISVVQMMILQGTTKVLMNSVTGRSIELRRGVRQGDPMAPYLFILAMDFLPVWFKELSQRGLFSQPFQGCKQCLLYADDTLFLLQPQEQQLQFLREILELFGDLSGLKINMQKSNFFMTTATNQEIQNKAAIIGCNAASFPLKYLGMPLSTKKLLKSQYQPLIAAIEKKLTK